MVWIKNKKKNKQTAKRKSITKTASNSQSLNPSVWFHEMYFNLKQCPVYLSASSVLRYFYRKPPYSNAMTGISVIVERTDNSANKIYSTSPDSSHKFHSYITIFHGLANFKGFNKKSCLSSSKKTWEPFQGTGKPNAQVFPNCSKLLWLAYTWPSKSFWVERYLLV